MPENEFIQVNNSRKEGKVSRFFSWIMTILLICMIIMVLGRVIFYSQYGYFNVSGASMNGTINPDVTIYDKELNDEGKLVPKSQDGVLCHLGRLPAYGDMFIIKAPEEDYTEEDGEKTLIKRAIAFEGDKVSIFQDENNIFRVYVIRNGGSEVELLSEDYIDSESRNNHALWSSADGAVKEKEQVKYESLFYNNYLTGENVVKVDYQGRETSFYTIGKEKIFYLGDNRTDSKDSRYGKNRLGDVKDVIGVVEYVMRDVALKENRNMLWWNQISGATTFIFQEFSKFFAWNI